MRVLIVKTSSMGDVLHTLPALTDAQQAIPGIQFDWVVEEGFAQIPSWHAAGAIALLVYLVIAVSQLRMRKILLARGGEIKLKMWLYPWLTWLVIAFIIFVLVVMLFRPAQQLEVISTGLLAIGIICTVPIMSRWKKLLSWQKAPLQNTH